MPRRQKNQLFGTRNAVRHHKKTLRRAETEFKHTQLGIGRPNEEKKIPEHSTIRQLQTSLLNQRRARFTDEQHDSGERLLRMFAQVEANV